MKRSYQKPVAKKVTFNYEQVVASSVNCKWFTPKSDGFTGCETTIEGMIVTYALDKDGCGWWTPDGK